ncbi:MAG: SNF2-related protein [Flammeovirgaceae bacterium]
MMEDIANFIETHSITEIKESGKELFQNRQRLQFVNYEDNRLELKVKDSDSDFWHDTKIRVMNGDHIESECTCSYSGDGMCEHRVAALLYLADYLKRMPKLRALNGNKTYNQSNVTVKLSSFNEDAILAFIARHNYQAAKYIARNRRCIINRGNNNDVSFTLDYNGERLNMNFVREGDQVKTSCDCGRETREPLCIHKAGALLQFFYEDGEDAFFGLQNFDDKKNELLATYGYSLADEGVDQLFKFRLEKGEMVVEPTDNSILRLDGNDIVDSFNFNRVGKALTTASSQLFRSNQNDMKGMALGYFLELNPSESILPFKIIPFRGKLNKDGNRFTSGISQMQYGFDFSYFALMDEQDKKIFEYSEKLDEDQLIAMLQKQGFEFTGYYWETKKRGGFTEEGQQLLNEYLVSIYRPIFRALQDKMIFYSADEEFRVSSLSKLVLHNQTVHPAFVLTEDEDDLILDVSLMVGEELIPAKQVMYTYPMALMTQQHMYPINNPKDFQAVELAVKHPTMRVRKVGKDSFIKHVILPLLQNYPVDIQIDLDIQDIDGVEPEAKLYLGEQDNYLSLTPVFEYGEQQITHDQLQDLVFHSGNEIFRMKRDYDYEEEMVNILAATHEDFIKEGPIFYLDANKVLQHNWFFDIFDYLREKGYEVYGFKELKNFRYSPHKPVTEFSIKSGIDWFDCQITIRFGDQIVELKDIRKALLKDEHYVKLGDGTLGVLPEDWIRKYGTILKLGNVNKDELQLSKLHFSIIDEMYEEIDNEQVLMEIADKKRKLRDFEKIQVIQPSDKVKATLRDYQKSGLNWLHFLNEFGWGGCLADDMGLGKTLQTLAFIQSLKDKNPAVCCLVVAPTSLMFNWSNEIDKFTPDLNYIVHHGTSRTDNLSEFYQYNVVLTTYGVVVRDIEHMKDIQFDYVVLDESQAIKNVTSKRYKAVSLLQAANKLVLTGTPVENNTFELFAQMNFINRGILGPQEFFKQEYANPIDRKGETNKVVELKKIVYPFILRRTKEQVAKDLPDKLETVLYCEMNTKQRKVYDAYKNFYRDKILDLIEEQGIQKSGVFILEGLLRLRQICDSPALVKSTGPEAHTEESVKLNELGNHVQEVVSGHKVLIFSQFVGMLNLIRKQMERKGIEYSYLDGQTRNREEVVADFQTNPDKRVFLISLKAGGVGLNLTAADYVFLVDPWWNPAVEQQAIDRTHRIGQTQNVFAYKMICKDTVEEKILKLQQKKKDLVADIISPEQSLLKSLTKDDIVELFS